MSIEEVEVGAVDSGGDPLFGLIPRVVGGAPDVDRVLTRTMSACLFRRGPWMKLHEDLSHR